LTAAECLLRTSRKVALEICGELLLQRELAAGMLRGANPPQAARDNLKTLRATFAAYWAPWTSSPAG
jgi:hypothetical protein